MSNEFDLEAFRADLRRTLDNGRIAFEGMYNEELNELEGLSRDEIDKITPDITDLEKYDELITVVKEASRVNLAQAHLRDEIVRLGEVAVKIAERVPSLGRILML
jgi:hypothetical protein